MGLSAPAPLGRRRRRGGAFRVPQLFANGEAGAWYDPSDLTAEKVAWRRNLLTWSQEFDNAAWTKSASTITANNIAAPDGTLTADRLVDNATNDFHGVVQNSTYAGPFTASIFARNVNKQFVSFLTNNNNATDRYAYFDIINKTTHNVNAGFTASITDVGGGWLRLSVSGISLATGSRYYWWNIAASNSTTAYLGDGTGALHIWGAQLDPSITASSYQRITDFTSDFLAAFPNHTLFQDSAGTTPVTALGQPVGRVLDTSGRGNHAIQATSASRPLLDGRVNLLTYSEQFDNAAWTKLAATVSANAAVAPDGTTTADKLIPSGALTNLHGTYSSVVTTVSGGSYQASAYVKAAEYGFAMVNCNVRASTGPTSICVDLATGSVSNIGANVTGYTVTATGNGWYRVTVTATPDRGVGYTEVYALNAAGSFPTFAGDGTSGILVWGGDFRLASDAAYPYQRVVTATDYADVGVPRSFLFDGFDDSLYTASNMNLSGTDKVTVLAGVRKLSDAALAIVAELTNNDFNSFSLQAPPSASARYRFSSTGATTTTSATSAASYTAPITNVLTGQGDINAPSVALRVNAVADGLSTLSQGGGNYASSLLYIGRRANSSSPFNGKAYQLIVRGALTDAATLVQAERFVAQRTGITL